MNTKLSSKHFIVLIIFLEIVITICSSWAESNENGLLSVYSEPSGLKIYLDGDCIGTTPIVNYSQKPGEYSISIFTSDTIEQKYWNIVSGRLGSRLSSLWDLSKVGAGTKRVVIQPNKSSEVFFSMKSINRTPNKVKIKTICCVGGGFSVAFFLGYLVANIVNGN